MDAGGSVSAVTWASCLSDENDPELISLSQALTAGASCLLMAGLGDPSGVSGLLQTAAWLSKHMQGKPSAVLLLPVHKDDDTALCRGVLDSGKLEGLLGHTALIGLP